MKIEYKGRTYSVRIEHDPYMGEPWKEHDGHGIVSDWTSRDKAPGERILVADRRQKRYYDVRASLGLARRDAWGISDEARAALAAKLGRSPTEREIAAAAVDADFEYLRAWCNGEWHWVGVIVEDEDGRSESLWGIESTAGDYLEDVARELAEETHSQWREDHRAEIRAKWEARKAKRERAKWSITAGRCITHDGKPFATIHKCEGVNPTDADDFARHVVALLRGEATA